jgi:hypothetical protein
MKKQGHISDHMSLLDIAKKHNVADGELRLELKKGIKVEQEHTSNIKTATRIALDHLFEDPKYYTKLAKIKLEENESSLNQDLVKEFMNHVTKELKLVKGLKPDKRLVFGCANGKALEGSDAAVE